MSDEIEVTTGPDEPVTDDQVPALCRSFCATTVKAVNKAEREVAHLITTKNPDRVGDVVEAGGADMANYLKHPVVVANHSYRIEDIIGRAISLSVTEDGIFARTKYRDTPLGRDAFNLAAEGLGAWSIGFRPIKFAAMKDEKGYTKGFHFTKWELLEYSQVAVPMNPDAVQNMVTRGLVMPDNIKTFFRVEDPARPAYAVPLGANAEPVPKRSPVASARDRRELARLIALIDNHEQSQELDAIV